jgi:uncharacterized OsmC-like protein
MAKVTAEAYPKQGRQIVFNARARAFVNVREKREDGAIGFTSGEMLLMALGNCALGTVMESTLVSGAVVERMTISLDAPVVRNPTRLPAAKVVIELATDDPALKGKDAELTELATTCPIANTVSDAMALDIQVNVAPGKEDLNGH